MGMSNPTAVTLPGTSRLHPLGEDVWQASTDVRQPGGVRLPLNMTVIRLPTGLVVVSPIAVDDALAADIAVLGEVRAVVAPSCLHHLFLTGAQARWPAARLLVPPGLVTKRPDLRVDGELPGTAPAEWRGALEVEVVEGAPVLGETVLFHHASGTLVCADLAFHVTGPVNLRTSVVLWLVGAGGGRLAQSRVWRFAIKDRERTAAAGLRILRWPIRRIAFAHGAACEGPDARPLLAHALRRMTRSHLDR
jgi:Domain of unknown function (DUF4336)